MDSFTGEVHRIPEAVACAETQPSTAAKQQHDNSVSTDKLQKTSQLTLSPNQITIINKSVQAAARTSEDTQSMRQRRELILKVTREQQYAKARMSLIRQQEERARLNKGSVQGVEDIEGGLRTRKHKLSQLFRHLEEYDKRKQKRKEEIEKFKKDLQKLKQEQSLYEIKLQDKVKKELPIISEKEYRLGQIKQNLRPCVQHRDIDDFEDRVFGLERRSCRPEAPETCKSKALLPALCQSPLHYVVSDQNRSKSKRVKTEVLKRPTRCSQETKAQNVPIPRASHSVVTGSRKRPDLPNKMLRKLGNSYLEEYRSFESGRIRNDEWFIAHKEKATSILLQGILSEHLTSSRRNHIITQGRIDTVESEQRYLKNIRKKLDILQYLVDQPQQVRHVC